MFRTMLSMVIIVTTPKMVVTNTKPKMLLFAAGYISNGINGSHGPKTNIVKSTHGVTSFVLFSI